MKRFRSIVLSILVSNFWIMGSGYLLGLCLATGCKSQTAQKQAVNSLFTLHKSVDLALNDYLDLVVAGRVKTNSLPAVMSAYGDFQAAFNLSVAIVGTNGIPPPSVVESSSRFISAVATAKGGSP